MGRPEIPDKKWPAVVAHRGASAAHPENTLAAFEAAIAEGADIVELDVRLTSDGVAVIMHDLDVTATTDGTGFLHQLTLEEVKRLNAAARVEGADRAEVPTLRETLELLGGRVGINLEVKNMPGEPSFDSPREAVVHQIVKLLDEYDLGDSALVSSFNWISIERTRELDPRIQTGFLSVAAIDPVAALVYAASHGHTFVLPQAPAVMSGGERFVREAHDEGLRVGTWTVDEPDAIRRLFEMGVDAVATNRPDVAIPIRDKARSGTPASGPSDPSAPASRTHGP